MMKLDSSRSNPSPRKGGTGSTHNNISLNQNGSISHRGSVTLGSPMGNNKNTRPLGSVRHIPVTESVTKFPPLPNTRSGDDSSIHFAGITGSALSVPPPKPPAEKPALIERLQQIHYQDTNNNREKHISESTLRKNTSSPRKLLGSRGSARSDSSAKRTEESDIKDKEIKRLKELHAKEMKEAMAREKDLKQQILLLQKQIEELKQQVLDRDQKISQLQQEFLSQEEKYKQLYEKECSRHKETQDYLQGVKLDLEKSRKLLERTTQDYESQIQALKTTMETSLSELRTEKDKEITIREEKLKKLKKQMADALKGNSWERQQQLDELSKELSKVQEECDMLKMKIRSLQKGGKAGGSNSGVCMNCETMRLQLSASQNVLREKDHEIVKLKQFTESKGHRG